MSHCKTLLWTVPLALAATAWAAETPAPKKPAPAAKPAVPAAAPVAPATAARKRLDVLLPASAGVPGELVPLKPGTKDKVPAKLETVLPIGPLSPISAISYSPDGAYLVAGSYSRASVWDVKTGKVLRHLDGVDGYVHDIEFSPDGKRLGVAGGRPGREGTVLVYDAANPDKPLGKLAGHSDVVYSFAWSPDSKRIATASLDKTVRIWDAAAGTSSITIKDHSDFVYGVTFSPDGALIASCGKDKAVKLFDSKTGKSTRALSGSNNEVMAVAFSTDGKSVLSTGIEPGIRWWTIDTGTVAKTVGGHGSEVYEIRFSQDRKVICTVSLDQTVRLWDGATGALQKTFPSGGEPLLSASISPDGKRVAAGGANGMVRIWDVATGRMQAVGVELPEKTPQPQYLMTTPEGYVSASEGFLPLVQWHVGGEAVPGEPFSKALAKPEEVQKSLRGEAVSPIKF